MLSCKHIDFLRCKFVSIVAMPPVKV